MSRRATVTMKLTALPSARVADRVIAISEAAKRDIVATVNLDVNKIDVTPLGVSESASTTPLLSLSYVPSSSWVRHEWCYAWPRSASTRTWRA